MIIAFAIVIPSDTLPTERLRISLASELVVLMSGKPRNVLANLDI